MPRAALKLHERVPLGIILRVGVFLKTILCSSRRPRSYFIIDQTRLYGDPARDEKNLKRFPWLIQVRPTTPVLVPGLEA